MREEKHIAYNKKLDINREMKHPLIIILLGRAIYMYVDYYYFKMRSVSFLCMGILISSIINFVSTEHKQNN